MIDYPAINRREQFSNVLWSCEILFFNMIYIVQVSLISILVIIYFFDVVASLYLKMELCDAFLTLSNQPVKHKEAHVFSNLFGSLNPYIE
jgi:hypothetical protein